MTTRKKTTTVSTPPELERSVASRVAAGFYRTASEVLHAALRLLDMEEPVEGIRPPSRREGSDGHVGPAS